MQCPESQGAIAFIVTGHILAALLIDHYGLRGLVPLTPSRLVGALLMVAGVFLARRS